MEINDRILERLEEWQEKEGSLPEILGFYRDLLRIQVEARGKVPSPQPKSTKAEIASQIRQGVPLLTWDALSIDWATFQDLFGKAANTINQHTGSAPESLRTIASEPSILQEATRAWYEGSPLVSLADRYNADVESLAIAIHCAVKPFLAAHSVALIESVPQKQWRRVYCPVCGGKPDFAFLEKEHGARWLLCSRCDSEWLFQRLQCPYCNTEDQDMLAYFSDESELYRLYICRNCNTYLKAIDLRLTESEILLPLERVLTADMDRQGEEEGFKAGWTGTTSDDKS